MISYIQRNPYRYRIYSLFVHGFLLLLLQLGVVMIGVIGNVIESDERTQFERNIIPMLYDLQDPIIGTIDNTYVVRVTAGFLNPDTKSYIYCENVIYDTCVDSEQCGSVAGYIITKERDGVQFQGWFYPSQGCKGVYFSKNFTPSYDMNSIIMGWLSSSIVIVIIWRQCCVRRIIETDLNILFCNGNQNHCCRRVLLPPVLDLRTNRGNQAHILIANPVAAERMTNIRPIKIVDEDDGMCIITMERIPLGGLYSECSQCKKIYSYTAIQQWLTTRQQCPHCRCSMTPSTVRMYQNGEASSVPTAEQYNQNEFMNYHQIGGGEVV